jgi:DNA polymerase elongation subunit (family B)
LEICEKQRDLVAESLAIPIQNRREYKQFRKLATDDNKTWALFEARQGMLRVIGHVSFGYQGHAHSHFGLIDVHAAVCAWVRYIANRARKTAERSRYQVLHVIIDSLFVKKPGSTSKDYQKLKEEIERATNFEISHEGEYKWLALLPSKGNQMIGVPNRYFGCYEDGTIKDRGIETRRHDTPPYFSKFQKEILAIMSEGDTIEEVKNLMPRIRETFERYRQQLKERRVQLAELVFTKMLSKNASAYSVVDTAETGSIYRLEDEGRSMRAGQVLQYVITNYYRKNSRKRSVPVELINEKTTFDTRRYIELLSRACNSLTEPFGYTTTSTTLSASQQ